MRPTYYSKRIVSLIKEEIDLIFKNIDEIFDTKLETKYEIINKRIPGYSLTVYRFKTNTNTQYDLEFIKTNIDLNTLLNNNIPISKILNINNAPTIRSIDIGFTLTERVENDNDVQNSEYVKNTNKHETIELMSRITYLVNKFINDNQDIYIYVVGKNTDESKLNIYRKMFSNIFNNDYKMFEGESMGYEEGAIYFINNKILK